MARTTSRFAVIAILAIVAPVAAQRTPAGGPPDDHVVAVVATELRQLGQRMAAAFRDLDFAGLRAFFSRSTVPMEKIYFLMNSPAEDMADVTFVVRPLRVMGRDQADVYLAFRMRNAAGETRQEITTAYRAKREAGR
jgi:hypothetical protein